MTPPKILKCPNQHNNWHGYHFLGWRFQISMFRRLLAKGRALLKGCKSDNMITKMITEDET